MVHFYSQTFHYDHAWSLVNVGIWLKYPNPYSAHVVSVDVLDRSVNPQTGVIRTERVIGCKQKAPRWVVKVLGGSDDAYVREVSFVNPRTQETSVTSVNLSLSQHMRILERISYSPCPQQPTQRTVFTQTAEINARVPFWAKLGESLEKWSVERFGQNAESGRIGFDYVLRSLWEARNGLPAPAEAS